MSADTCFEMVGMTVPLKKGGKCPCGALVRFDVAKARVDHFMVCPEVDRRITAGQVDVIIDEAAVEVGRKVFR